MANEEHRARLLAGVEGWNQWRRENPGIIPDLSGALLRRATLSEANLRRVDLSGADLGWANLNDADLGWAKLNNADLSGADLSGANLNQATLSWADLTHADFSHADLNDADLNAADLREGILIGANLSGADFTQATLIEADLSEADLSGAMFSYTVVGAIDLRDVRGLDTVRHYGPSTIGLDTIERSQGQIPESFLRGCGVSDRLIEYIPSLTAQPIQYYSCFISYSSHDEALAQRLYTDLQAKGVRCWYAPEDLKIGDSLFEGIDQGIRLHEKLLIILSESSLASAWVAREVRAAQAREVRERRRVLFPIRIDDAVQQSDQGWAVELWDQRKIGDFCGWKDHDTYQAAFARLLRDLKATPDR